MKPQSAKGAERNRKYADRRLAWLSLHGRCQIGWEGCEGGRPYIVHHAKGRVGKFLLDESTWVACCSTCHTAAHANPARARAEGFMGSRVA